MSKYSEVRKGFVDCFHSKAKANGGSPSLPDFEGRLKLNGEEFFLKLWLKPKPGVTNDEMLSGYVYSLEKAE